MIWYAMHCLIFWQLNLDYTGDELSPGLQPKWLQPILNCKLCNNLTEATRSWIYL